MGELGIDESFLEETRAFWQPYTTRKLTHEDAREMIENVTGFFGVLAKWDAERKAKGEGIPSPLASTSADIAPEIGRPEAGSGQTTEPPNLR